MSPISKKLNEVEESTKNLGEVIKESNSENINKKALPTSSNFSKPMREMLGSLLNSHNSLKITYDKFGQANILGVPIEISGAHIMKINENIFELFFNNLHW